MSNINQPTINTATLNASGASGPPQREVALVATWDNEYIPPRETQLSAAWDIPDQFDTREIEFGGSWVVRDFVRGVFEMNNGLIVDGPDGDVGSPTFSMCLDMAVQTDFIINVAWTATLEFEPVYSLLTPVDIPFELDAGDGVPDKVDVPFQMDYDLTVGLGFEASAGLLHLTSLPWDVGAGLLDTVTLPFEAEWDLGPDTASLPFEAVWSLIDEDAIVITGGITLTIDETGEEIGIESGRVEISQGGTFWIGDVQLADPRDIGKFAFDQDVTLSIFGEDYLMAVDTQELGRQAPAVADLSLRVISRAARFASPRAEKVTLTFDTPITATAALAALLPGATIDFQMGIDWLIPAGALGADDADPMQVAQQIAEAGGGTIETTPAATFIVRELFPTRVADYESATPAHTFAEAEKVLSSGESFEFKDLFNRFRITNATESGARDQIEFVADEDSGLTGSVFVYPSPFRAVELETTSDTAIGIFPQGEVLTDQEQCIEFKDGASTVSRPVDSIVSVEWLDDDLGAVTFDPGGTELRVSDPTAYGLALVNYRSKALEWRVSSPVDDKVQFLVVDC